MHTTALGARMFGIPRLLSRSIGNVRKCRQMTLRHITTGPPIAAPLLPSPPPTPPLPPMGFPRKITAAVLLSLYVYHISTARDEAIKASDLPTEDESIALLTRARISSDQMRMLYASLMSQYPRGVLTLEQFSRAVENMCRIQRNNRAEARKRNNTEEERLFSLFQQEVLADKEPDAKKPAEDEWKTERQRIRIGSFWDEDEVSEEAKAEKGAAGITDGVALSELRHPHFEWFESFLLFKHSPQLFPGYYDIRELFIGFSQCVYDHNDWNDDKEKTHQQKSGKTPMTRRQRWMLSYDQYARFGLIWSLSDTSNSGRLSYRQFVELCERLVRTGHFIDNSILRSYSDLPSKFAFLTGEHIAEMYMTQLHRSSTILPNRSPEEIDNDQWLSLGQEISIKVASEPVQYFKNSSVQLHNILPTTNLKELPSYLSITPPLNTPIAEKPTPLPFVEKEYITYGQFVSMSRLFAETGLPTLWYAQPRDEVSGERLGGFKKWRYKWADRFRMQCRKYMTSSEQMQLAHQLL